MKITLEGTSDQIIATIKALIPNGNASELLSGLADAGILAMKEGVDSETIYQALETISWETFYLAHIIYLRGEEDSKGKYMTFDQLEKIPYTKSGKTMTERSMSARVGGAKKVSKRFDLKDYILDIKVMPGREKRFYLSDEVITTFEQYLEKENDRYKEDLVAQGEKINDELIYPTA